MYTDPRCSAIIGAPSGLPKNGSYDKRLVGILNELHVLRAPHKQISTFMGSALGLKITKLSVINSLGRSADCMKPVFDSTMDHMLASVVYVLEI